MCAPSDMSKKKLAILLENDMSHCWVCGFRARTLAPLVKKYGSIDQWAEYRENFESANSTLMSVPRHNIVALPKDFKLLTVAGSYDPDTRAVRRYAESRGLSERDMWYYKLGVSDEPRWKRRLVMPSFDENGSLNFFVGRAIDDRLRPKYDNPDDIDRLPIVFNEINVDWTSRLVLCEGPFDLVKCGENATPLLGSELSEESALFNKILINSTPVYVALDGDTWHHKLPRLVKKLSEYDVDVLVVDVRPWGDPGKMTRSEFEGALKDAKPMTWGDTFADKLERATKTNLRIESRAWR